MTMGPAVHNSRSKTPSLTDQLPPLILGGAGFSRQQHSLPESIPVVTIVKRAFDLGMRCIDTSPYYEPSESLLGEALASPTIAASYTRADYILMTKVGRIAVDKFDYSAEWIRTSVARSLQRLRTTYLDVVFVHDIEFMPPLSALAAVATLVAIANERSGIIRNIGVSGYSLQSLVELARLVREHLHRPLDVVQVWARLSLQNSTLATDPQYGLIALRDAGVKCVCSSSPLAAGLLRDRGVPVGALGDWHPAPQGLREVCAIAATWLAENAEEVRGRKEQLASVALRYALAKAWRVEREVGHGKLVVRTVVGASSIDDIEANVKAARMILKVTPGTGKDGIAAYGELDEDAERQDSTLFQQVRGIIGPWLDYDFSSRQKSSAHSDGNQLSCTTRDRAGVKTKM
ncbi:Aldo/keto reductase family-domain-containing protein [Xylogone sp. PMI_703]|nr:Aldo/keto reductase family-domain-containing protein [Xylogone sp. PMI_703]